MYHADMCFSIMNVQNVQNEKYTGIVGSTHRYGLTARHRTEKSITKRFGISVNVYNKISNP